MSLGVFIFCIVVGVLCGTTGVGGIVLPPAFMYWEGMETHSAMAITLSSFMVPSLFAIATFRKRGWFDWKASLPLAVGGFVGGIPGGSLNAYVPGKWLVCLLACIIIFAGVAAVRPQKEEGGTRHAFWHQRRGLFCIGAFTGFMAGMTGAGGAVLSIPWMVAVGYSPMISMGAAMLMQVGIILTATVGNAMAGHMLWGALFWLTVALVLGFWIGMRIVMYLPVRTLRIIIGVLCVGLGFFLLFRNLLG